MAGIVIHIDWLTQTTLDKLATPASTPYQGWKNYEGHFGLQYTQWHVMQIMLKVKTQHTLKHFSGWVQHRGAVAKA